MGRTTNKQRRDQQAATARERAAAARAEQKRQEQRRRAVTIIGSVVGVAVVVVVIAIVAITHKSTPSNTAGSPVNATVLKDVTGVSQDTLNTVGLGSAALSQKKITGAALAANGKPELLFVGAQYCPYCAAERWAMVQALSRFGTFSNLHEITSAEDSLPTFDFYKSSYASKYLSFVPKEQENQKGKPLETLTSAQSALFQKYAGGGYPFLDFGGLYYQEGAGYVPTVLSGKTHSQVASSLNTPSNTLAKNIDGEANKLTALICTMTKNQPAKVCAPMLPLQAKFGA